MKPGFGFALLITVIAVLLAGCGGGTKTVTETAESQPPTQEAAGSRQEEGPESLGGPSSEAAQYSTPAEVGKAIVDDIESRYGDGFEGGQCENFLPEFGGTPVYLCEIKMGGEYHSIEATIHPDGSFEWIESGGAISGNYEGSELSVHE